MRVGSTGGSVGEPPTKIGSDIRQRVSRALHPATRGGGPYSWLCRSGDDADSQLTPPSGGQLATQVRIPAVGPVGNPPAWYLECRGTGQWEGAQTQSCIGYGGTNQAGVDGLSPAVADRQRKKVSRLKKRVVLVEYPLVDCGPFEPLLPMVFEHAHVLLPTIGSHG